MMPSPISSAFTGPAIRFLNRNQGALAQSLQRLASGKKVNAGKDDPAALISSERLAAEIAALEAESRANERANANANITDGHLSEASSLLHDLNRLVVASGNEAGLTDAEREANQLQIDSIVSNIQRFTGDAIGSLNGFSLPDNGNEALSEQLRTAAAGLTSLVSGGSNSLASGHFEDAQNAISAALTGVVTARGTIGSHQKTNLDPRSRSIQIARENLTESRSRLIDTDYAEETSQLSRAQTLVAANGKTLKIAQRLAGSLLDLLA
jgi:flagellin